MKDTPKAVANNAESENDLGNPAQDNICGIIMPISGIDGCPESHWKDVINIIGDSVKSAGFEPNIVSNADNVGIILKTIVRNLYWNPIVVCDVSCRNPNVMFELGMRLAFDKPVVIVKDDKTSYSFDTSGIEHIEYPRDLRYNLISGFKEKLADKIKATHDKAKTDKNQNSFLRNFGDFTVAVLEQKEVPVQKYLLSEMESIKELLRKIDLGSQSTNINSRNSEKKWYYKEAHNNIDGFLSHVEFDLTELDDLKTNKLIDFANSQKGIKNIQMLQDDVKTSIRFYFDSKSKDMPEKLLNFYFEVKSSIK